MGTVKWIKDTTSRIELVSGGKTYELLEKWVWNELFGLAGDSAWFPTSIQIFPNIAKAEAESKMIPGHDHMVLKEVSAFG